MANRLKIGDLSIDYFVDYRNIKHPRLEFKTGNLLIVLPKDCKENGLIEKHKEWIRKRELQILGALRESETKELADRNIDDLKQLARQYVTTLSNELKASLNNVYFRTMKTKWASCSSRKNLTINSLLKYLPDEYVQYVVYHELVHLKERKHSKRFWSLVNKKFESYQKKEKDLFVYWFLVQKYLNKENVD